MKTQFLKPMRCAVAFSVSLAFWLAGSQGAAQPAAELDVETYAGLSIEGTAGTVYSIEYTTNLNQLPEPEWRCLEMLRLPLSPYVWADKSAPVNGKRFYRAVAMATPTNMVFIPPGTFRMGTPSTELDRQTWEGPQTEVTLSQGFWMGQHEVTQAEYQAVVSMNPSSFKGDSARPVEMVSWSDAISYCGTLTMREQHAGLIPPGSTYRLPTEAEWEYACRAGTSTRFSYGDDGTYADLANYAWYGDNSGDQTHPVGQKLPNAWGLYDMHGNVWEWCQDWWADSYPGGIQLDPQGPTLGLTTVIRGGSWGGGARFIRSGSRSNVNPGSRGFDFGFRVVLSPVTR